jgi:hypothetical protein
MRPDRQFLISVEIISGEATQMPTSGDLRRKIVASMVAFKAWFKPDVAVGLN